MSDIIAHNVQTSYIFIYLCLLKHSRVEEKKYIRNSHVRAPILVSHPQPMDLHRDT